MHELQRACSAARTFHSNRDHDLSDLGIGFHIAVGFDDLSKGKCSRDDRFEVPVGEMVEDVMLCLPELIRKMIRIRHDLEEGISLDRKVLAEGEVDWVWRRFICQN